MQKSTCYMCSRIATSREHAPPRCLFPSTKDVPNGANYRRNLITVPSCNEHNSEKSHDDEYLLFALAGSYTSSSVGLAQFTSKVKRAFDRQPSKRLNFIHRSAPVRLKRLHDSEWEQGAQVIIEGGRIDSVLANCARALYFFSTGSKFFGPTRVMTNFTMYQDADVQRNVTAAFEAAAVHFEPRRVFGDNPEVFSYKFDESESSALFWLSFYEGSTALVQFQKIVLSR